MRVCLTAIRFIRGGGAFFLTDSPCAEGAMKKMYTKLFVGNLARNTTEDDLNTLFAQVGTVASVELIKIRETSSPKCFAFVDMNSRDEAEKAIDMLNGSDLNRRAIKVNLAKSREKRPEGGGWYTDPPPPGNRRRKRPSGRK
jgi:RNA recognition motif-containing protein